MKKHTLRILMGLAVVALLVGHAAALYRLPLLDRLEALAYDARLKFTMPGGVDPRIVILDIDEHSLREKDQGGEGRWPWPRDRLALLLDKLFDHHGVAVAAFDVVFAERDASSGLPVLEQLGARELRAVPQFGAALRRLRERLDYDDMLARKMQGRNVVLGYAFSKDERAMPKGVLPPAVLSGNGDAEPAVSPISWRGYTGNLPELQKNAKAAGHSNPHTDRDGVTRRVPMLVEYGGAYYEPLALAVVRALLGLPPVKLIAADEARATVNGRVEFLDVGSFRIPVDGELAALVPYRGPRGSYAYYSVVDVLHDRVPTEALRGKIVLIGTTAPGLKEQGATPVGAAYPAVEIHANLIAGILDRSITHRPGYVRGAEVVLLGASGLGLALLLPLLAPLRAALLAGLAFVAVVAVNAWIFQEARLVLPLASGLALIVLLSVLNIGYGGFLEARGRCQIRALFGQYVAPQLVEEMARDPARFSMESESREMTVLFADVRNFTRIAEGLDPGALSALMNEFLTPLTEVIYRHRGTIDKYQGDCIMAFWGAPVSDPHHARNAVLAALEMQRTVLRLEPAFRARNWPEIRIGIGINTGRMSVGDMGSRSRRAYTVMGDAVVLASRLEGITRAYGADIIVGEETRQAVPDVVFLELDRVRVKGRDAPVAIYEPLGLRGEVDPAGMRERERFRQALDFYRKQRWDDAETSMHALEQETRRAKRYRTFLQRIGHLRRHSPGCGWDGTHNFTARQ